MLRQFGSLAASLLLAGSAYAAPTASSFEARTTDFNRRMSAFVMRLQQRIDALEKQKAEAAAATPAALPPPGASPSPSGVDLTQMNRPGASSSSTSAGSVPAIKFYFDMWLYAEPGKTPLSFSSFHNVMMIEYMPSNSIMFTSEIRQVPRFFELTYKFSSRAEIKVGQIWIPFDEMSPHNIYGGRMNVSQLRPGTNAFLPDLWTETGVALKFKLADSTALSSELSLYLTNGFSDGGTDPSTATASSYPNFSGSSGALFSVDNNYEKAVGGRWKATIGNVLTLGVSGYYNHNWTDLGQPRHPMTIVGTDGSIRFSTTELRAGISTMAVTLPSRSMTRTGLYGELAQRLGQRFKIMARGGVIQADSGVLDSTSDYTLVGGGMSYRMGPLELSLQYSHDLQDIPAKKSLDLAAGRLAITF